MSTIKKLDLSALEKAIARLEESLHYYHSEVVQRDPKLILQLRAAAIQAFEFTYEVSWKMLKRYLEMSEPNAQTIDEMSFPDLIRTGCERGLLLSDLVTWKQFRHERSATGETYEAHKAQEVFEHIPLFLKDAKYLLEKLQEETKTL